MPIDSVVNILANFGFPAIMCGILFWYMDRQNNFHRQEIKSLMEELTQMRDIVSSLDRSINKLIHHLEKGEKS